MKTQESTIYNFHRTKNIDIYTFIIDITLTTKEAFITIVNVLLISALLHINFIFHVNFIISNEPKLYIQK